MENVKLTSYEEMAASLRTAIVETQSGKKFEIKAVNPGDLLVLVGSPVLNTIQNVADRVSKTENNEEIADHMVRVLADKQFNEQLKAVICFSIISLNLVIKEPEDCDPAFQEISVSLLSIAEQMQLYTAIVQLSNNDIEVKDFYSFRKDSEGEIGDDGKNSPDSESLQSETVNPPISEPDKSAVQIND